jgi:hypothetical protein
MKPLTVYVFNRRALRAPLILAAVLTVYVGWRGDWIALVGLPLIYVAWLGCAPNANLVNGCLPLLATIVVLVLGLALRQIGLIVAAGVCGATWFAASVESGLRCWPEVVNTEPSDRSVPAAGPDSDGESSPPAR